MTITKFNKAYPTSNKEIFIIGERLGAFGNHAGWVYHFGAEPGIPISNQKLNKAH